MIGSYLAQEVWRRANAGPDEYGQPTFETAVKSRGRWTEKRRLVRNADGVEVLSEISVTLTGGEPLESGDQVSLDGETWFEVIAISRGVALGGGRLTTRAFC